MAQGSLSPRQRMINMMYLVLTAMLALNVSNEVLDAFETIETRFGQSIEIVRQNNENRFNSFDAAAKVSSEEKVKPWRDKAQIVKDKTQELIDYIDSLKRELINYADGEKARKYTGKLSDYKLENREDTDVGTRLLWGNEESQGKGYELKEKIEKYKTDLVEILSESENGKSIIATIEGMLNTSDVDDGVDGIKDWINATFYNAPAISDLAILSSIILDIRNCEGNMINYLVSQIDGDTFKFSEIEVAVIPNSSYIIKGTPLEAKIFLAAYDPNIKVTARISGTPYQSDSKGQILYKALQNAVGLHHLTGSVDYPGPDGMKQTKTFDFPYQVGEAAAVISPTKMNVFYIGVENPVEISVSGVPQEKISVSCNGGALNKQGTGYVVIPNAGSKTCDISVSAEINGTHQPMKTQPFRVKKLPTPVAIVSGLSGKTATKSELETSLGVIAKMPDDFEFDLKYTVTSFKVSVTGGKYDDEAASNGAAFSQAQKTLFSTLRSGQRVFISDIKATGPGGVVDLATIDIKIK